MFLNYLLLIKMVKAVIIELAILNGNINHKLYIAKILNKMLSANHQQGTRDGSEQREERKRKEKREGKEEKGKRRKEREENKG